MTERADVCLINWQFSSEQRRHRPRPPVWRLGAASTLHCAVTLCLVLSARSGYTL
jgi:cytochrome b561